jgi:hypothetical protein
MTHLICVREEPKSKLEQDMSEVPCSLVKYLQMNSGKESVGRQYKVDKERTNLHF